MKHILAIAFAWVTKIEELCLTWAMILIALLTIGNVIGRTFDRSLAFAEELSQFLIILVTFIGLGYAASRARHIRMTALYDTLGEAARKPLALWISASTAILLLALTALSVDYILGTVRVLGSVSPVLQVPLWIVYLAAPLGLLLAALQYALAFARNLTSEGVWLSFEHDDGYEDEPAPGV